MSEEDENLKSLEFLSPSVQALFDDGKRVATVFSFRETQLCRAALYQSNYNLNLSKMQIKEFKSFIILFCMVPQPVA